MNRGEEAGERGFAGFILHFVSPDSVQLAAVSVVKVEPAVGGGAGEGRTRRRRDNGGGCE